MISKLVRKQLGIALTKSIRHSYVPTEYTQTLKHQNQFQKVPTFRLTDLEGQLLDKNHQYDTALLLKMLKAMIFVDEMDSILLKIKSQGTSSTTQARFPST